MISKLPADWKRNAGRLTTRDRVIDTAIAVLTFGAGVGLLFSHGLGEPHPNTRDGDLLGVALLALASFPLALRRVAPSLVLVVAVAVVVPMVLLRYPGEVSNLPLLAIYSLAAAGDRDPLSSRAAMALAAGAFVALATAVVIIESGFPAPEVSVEAILWLAVWIAGDRTRLRRERIAQLEERVQRAEREAERERRLAAAEERTKIARELHDSAGHAMILVEAGAARLLRDRDPDRSRAALETIEQVARGTIGEIDRLVRHLRDYGRADDVGSSPLPGVADIDALAERQSATGRPVSIRVDGEKRRLPADVDRAAYRIVQEALMNAVKHGGGSAEVVVAYGTRELEVSVTNPMRPNGSVQSGGGGGGHGIVGMRERASLLGGSLEASGENGVFHVRALLPYHGEAA